jgi:hypothetical protein
MLSLIEPPAAAREAAVSVGRMRLKSLTIPQEI